MSRNAVVLGGGGSKGAYEIGVFKGLKKVGYKFDIITGTSVGSLNGVAVAQGDFSAAENLWKTIKTSDVFDFEEDSKENIYKTYAKEFISENGLSCNNLKKTIGNILDEEKLKNSKIDFGLVTVEFPGMIPHFIYKEDMEEGKVLDYVLASSACFPAMHPYRIGDKLFIDGGYNDNIPIDMAVKKGATTIVAVDLKAIGITKNKKYQGVKIIKIESYCDLGNFLIFDENTAKKNIRIGYLDTLKAFNRLEGYRYSFKPGECDKIYKSVYPYFIRALNDFKKDKKLKKFVPVALLNIKKSYNLKLGLKKNVSRKDYIVLILENLMELLKIPNFEKYTKRKCHFLVRKAYGNIKLSNIEKLNEIALNFTSGDILKNMESIKNVLKNLDKLEIIKYIETNIDLRDKNAMPFLLFLAVVMPVEFSSGLYVYILKRKQKKTI